MKNKKKEKNVYNTYSKKNPYNYTGNNLYAIWISHFTAKHRPTLKNVVF